MTTTGYVRQSAATIVSGNTIQASDFNNEYNQLQSAFDATVGHTHDGTAGGGQNINLTAGVTGILPVANGGTNSAYFGVAGLTAARTFTLPDNNATLVTTTNTQTLTFKTLTSPILTTPTLGVATATSINKMAITAPATSSTLAVADGKTLTASNTLTLAGTDGTTITFQATGTYVSRTSTDTLTNKTLTSPVLTTPTLGVATATSINKVAITAPATSATLTIADGKALTASNTLTLAGTDGTTITFQGTGTYVSRTSTDTLTNKTIDSPTLTGTPVAPTASAGDSSTQLATTAFVTGGIADSLGFKAGTTTYNLATASGTQAITGLGFAPRAILVFATVNGTNIESRGFSDGSTNRCVYDNSVSSAGTYGTTAAALVAVVSTGNIQTGIISLDSDGFTITWTKLLTPTGTLTINYLAMR